MPNQNPPKPIIIFASGRGTNAETIISYFNNKNVGHVCLLVCNKSNAIVLDVARKYQIPYLVIDKFAFEADRFIETLKEYNASLIVLAGFLWKIPKTVLSAFPNKIINIHPALLPKYGGKGMYGKNVHQAVRDANELKTGITIHLVNENYDEGTILMQATCPVLPTDSVDDIAAKVADLEHAYFPITIDLLLQKQ